MAGHESGLLAQAEAAEPVASVDVVARRLRERFGARSVSFLFVDLIERQLVRLTEEGRTQSGRSADRVRLQGSDYDTVLTTQDLRQVPDDDGSRRVIAPVTNRGDTIGVLELTLPAGKAGGAGVLDACHGKLNDDATVLCLDWHGPQPPTV